jgi:hypothetical protein
VIETLGRFPGLTGIFIACILSATLSTFSSGVNSIAAVIVEDIYKRLSNKDSMSNEHQVFLSKILCKCYYRLIDNIDFVVHRRYSGDNWLFDSIFCIFGVLYEKQYSNSISRL